MWPEVGRKGLRMADTSVEGAAQRPTWEDVEAHNASVTLVLGLRMGDCHGVPHERDWERRVEWEEGTEGPETRSGKWGCMACRGADVEHAAEQREKGVEVSVPAHMPLATVRHWTAGRCAALDTVARGMMEQGARQMQKAVKHLRGEGAAKVQRVVDMAVGACTREGGAHDAEWRALQQVMAGQLVDVEETVTRAGPQKGKAAREVDAARRMMVWGAVQQVKHAKEKSWKWETWRREREAHRAWMLMVLRAWRAEAGGVNDRKMLERVTQLRRTRWRALRMAEVKARRMSVKKGRRVMILAGREGGDGRGKTVRTDAERWWARLIMKTRALQAWAVYMTGVDARWVADGRVRSGARVANGPTRRARARGTRVAVPAGQSTRLGARLEWWIAEGEGWDAGGPWSVRRGRRTREEADGGGA